MGAKNLFCLILLGAMMACSGPENEKILSPVTKTGLQKITFAAAGLTDYSVTAFLLGEQGFTFYKTFDTGWSVNGKLTVQLPCGKYQFLFARSFGLHTRFLPELPTGTTSLKDIMFSNRLGNTGNDLLPGDELFLKDGQVDSVYSIFTATTVQCNLKRAVSQLILQVKRGKKTGEAQYEPLAYPKGENILRHIDKIKLDITGAGIYVDAMSKPHGQGNLSVEMAAASADTITAEGFAGYRGPFFFPAENGGAVTVDLTLMPALNAPQPALTFRTQAVVTHNQQLIITAWIANDWNFVDVTANTRPIEDEIGGEQDIWDDQITQP